MKSKREQEEDKKKADEAEAAKVYEDFYNTFVNVSDQKNKVWVKAGTFDAGSRKEDTRDKGKLYKPTSKLEELREKFSSAESASQNNVNRNFDRPERPGKKKEKEKKKSNLELFKEELKMIQEERAERHRIKGHFRGDSNRATRFEAADPKPPPKDLPLADDVKPAGSFDTGDPSTTNIYLGNLNPQTTEQRLMELFGRFGPLASVKIMWPRTDDERSRGRNCGFVAFMNRKDGERCITALNSKEIDSFEMKLGWGKCVPIPPHPIYIPPSLMELTLPPPPSGLPFNCQPTKEDRPLLPPRKIGFPMDFESVPEKEKILQRAVVKVVIPTERELLHLIHRMIEFVIREGPMFEAMIMNREINNIHFRFLFDNQSPAHAYYRWKLFSILQGDAQNVWRTKPFRMFQGGSIWRPPPINPFHQGMPEELYKKEEAKFDAEFNKKGSLSDAQRKRLESMIRRLTPEKDKVGEAMIWCIEHAEAAYEICQCFNEALSDTATPFPKKIARLYLVSDILHNCSIKVANASFFRKYLEENLSSIFVSLHEAYEAVESRLKAEQVKQRVMKVIRAWEDWAVYPPEFLIKLQNVFLGLDRKGSDSGKGNDSDEYREPVNEETTPKDDLDGIALDDVDGFPLESALFKNGRGSSTTPEVVRESALVKKSAGISALVGYGDDDDSQDEDIDGAPLDDDIDGTPLESRQPGFVPSKWESVSPKRVEEQAMTLSKWDELEASRKREETDDASDTTPVYDNPATPSSLVDDDMAKKYDVADQDDLDGTPLEYDDYQVKRRRADSSEDEEPKRNEEEEEEPGTPNQSYGPDSPVDRLQGDSEERRAKLRAVEIKVLQYQDELERGIRPVKHGYTLPKQVQHYRHKLIKKVMRDNPASSDRKSRRRKSSSPEERKSKKSRSPHRSQHRGRSRSPRRHRSRSPKRRRSRSRSASRKHKKKRR